MKKLGTFLLSFSLLIALFPQITMAAQDTNFEQDLINYLEQVSNERGFEVTKEDIALSLSYYEDSLENYNTVEELSQFLGEIIKADYSNVDSIYEQYELTEESLVQLLKENGEQLSDYIFLDDLDTAVYFYTEDGTFERDPNFEQNLIDYLADVSDQRGYNVTRDNVVNSLAIYESNLEDFESVEQLSDFLGEVIQADYSNLDYFVENYGLSQQELFNLLESNDENINDYIYIDDLDNTVWKYVGNDLSVMFEYLTEDLLPLFQEIDLTDEELKRFENHLISLEDHFSNPETLELLEQLNYELIALESDMNSQPTVEQMEMSLSILEKIFSILQLKASYSLVNDAIETPISLMDLMKMEVLEGTDLKVAFYSSEGQFLGDLIITEEFINSGLVTDLGEQIVDSAVEQPPVVQPKKQINTTQTLAEEYHTVKGGKLPKTASDYIPNALFGLFIVMLGIFMYGKVRTS
ncbi:processed acidic surface protein [Lysinibacillus telephonicus]|uniref:Processed acidic surface protein n=1 Tax=Lysinibacillus telephonicus TaxID=1714840 RepID=A0A3S0I2G8_9BACI|nr:processed acidic surface protein [Lysinibacillus telephonicus]RTQ93991.1 processed acidic surface protein [Lysinibacillus telephonicus]